MSIIASPTTILFAVCNRLLCQAAHQYLKSVGGPKKAVVPYFSLYELRHTLATRLSAGGLADRMVMQMLRQGDAEVFKLYSRLSSA
ncbi:MAG: hypothetical protein ACRD6B_14260 [Bryobacteraceae bacterium]